MGKTKRLDAGPIAATNTRCQRRLIRRTRFQSTDTEFYQILELYQIVTSFICHSGAEPGLKHRGDQFTNADNQKRPHLINEQH